MNKKRLIINFALSILFLISFVLAWEYTLKINYNIYNQSLINTSLGTILVPSQEQYCKEVYIGSFCDQKVYNNWLDAHINETLSSRKSDYDANQLIESKIDQKLYVPRYYEYGFLKRVENMINDMSQNIANFFVEIEKLKNRISIIEQETCQQYSKYSWCKEG